MYDDATRLVDPTRAAGVDVTPVVAEGMPHLWQLYAAVLPAGAAAVDRIAAHISAHIPSSADV